MSLQPLLSLVFDMGKEYLSRTLVGVHATLSGEKHGDKPQIATHLAPKSTRRPSAIMMLEATCHLTPRLPQSQDLLCMNAGIGLPF